FLLVLTGVLFPLAIVAVDPGEVKREKALEFGATHTCASMDEAMALVGELSWGRMADLVLLTMGEVHGEHLLPGLSLTGKGRRCVVVGLGNMMAVDAQLSILDLAMQQKTLQGAIFGGTGPRKQIPHLLHQYRAGNLKLDELITKTYRLEEINQGYQDMRDGKNLRGVIIYDEQDW
ncbi:MAG TPA: zinc-binding dehydrogenase, partial [Dietzia sp.]|nr:zinc-binding dehydrogenase [Dietzia sp.]